MSEIRTAITDDLRKLANVAWASKASYEIYDALTNEESQTRFLKLRSRYHEFFGATIQAHLVRTIVALGVLYDKRGDTDSIKNLLLRLKKVANINQKAISEIQSQIERRPSLVKVLNFRHKAIAHLSSKPTIKEVLKETKLIKQDLQTAIEDTTNILGYIGRLVGEDVSFTVVNPPGEGTRALLSDFFEFQEFASAHAEDYLKFSLARVNEDRF